MSGAELKNRHILGKQALHREMAGPMAEVGGGHQLSATRHADLVSHVASIALAVILCGGGPARCNSPRLAHPRKGLNKSRSPFDKLRANG
jgi:hypothetical protein